MIRLRPAKSVNDTGRPAWSVRVNAGAGWPVSRRGMKSLPVGATVLAQMCDPCLRYGRCRDLTAQGATPMAEQTSPSPDATSPGATTPAATTPAALSPDAIEAEIAQTRAHLASTIDELTVRAHPREIVRRQKESAKAKFVDATHTPEGDLRVERVGAMAAAGSVVVLVLAILHRRHRRG